ncbi:MAG: hydantoinase/oxoprolinase family protein [Alphaproteobacteria bacterium]|nr:hydantoinase/oxoprolinase family protein [Alphaproteobacteria bacterium]
MSYRVGVDIGGTFTDFCVFSEATNTVQTLKVLSTPEEPGREVIRGLEELAERHGVDAGEIVYLTHGTTVGVNTVIQRKGINLCLFVTENFEDVLELARLKMPDPYDLFSRRPVPLVGREKVFSIRGRVLADGSVDQPVDEASVLAALAGVREVGGEGVVIALLHAYRNPAHEEAVRDILAREAPELAVVCASEVWPVIREYERTVTAVVAGYAQPRVSRYLDSLQRSLTSAGVPVEPMITKSNGGIMSAELAKGQCAQVLLSGTAAGVIGAAHVARMTDTPETMSFDVGGTSADVAFIRGGEAQYGIGEVIGEFPIYIPTVSVTSIGEGGGSIAHVDSLGVLKVGPESAGSNPGPACYGLGGERATLTDAFAVLGFLGQSDLGYSAVRMHEDLAEKAVDAIARQLDLGRHETAEAIVRVAVSGMFLEVSKLVSRYGIDPRDFTLQAFGGAGPMLACFLAREMGMRRVVVPITPGVLSAFGGLIADVKNDFIRTVYLDLDSDTAAAALREGYAELRREALGWLQDEQGFDGPYRLVHSADMRYRGQSFEIETHFSEEAAATGDAAAMAGAFHDEHQRVYDHADSEAPVQAINLRLVVVGEAPKPEFKKLARSDAAPEPSQTLEVFYDGGAQPAPLYDRAALLAGQRFQGPAVISQDDCTTCVLDGFAGEIDDYGNIILTSGA